jgi:hypothetical protein
MTRPFRTTAAGLVLVFLDFRLYCWDVLPDVLGYFLAAVALGAAAAHPMLCWGRICACIATAAALPTSFRRLLDRQVKADVSVTCLLTDLGRYLDCVQGVVLLGLSITVCLGIRALAGKETEFGRRALRTVVLVGLGTTVTEQTAPPVE